MEPQCQESEGVGEYERVLHDGRLVDEYVGDYRVLSSLLIFDVDCFVVESGERDAVNIHECPE